MNKRCASDAVEFKSWQLGLLLSALTVLTPAVVNAQTCADITNVLESCDARNPYSQAKPNYENRKNCLKEEVKSNPGLMQFAKKLSPKCDLSTITFYRACHDFIAASEQCKKPVPEAALTARTDPRLVIAGQQVRDKELEIPNLKTRVETLEKWKLAEDPAFHELGNKVQQLDARQQRWGIIFTLISMFVLVLAIYAAILGRRAKRLINGVDKRLRGLREGTDKGSDKLDLKLYEHKKDTEQVSARLKAEVVPQPQPQPQPAQSSPNGGQDRPVEPQAQTRATNVVPPPPPPPPPVSIEDLLFAVQNAADSAIADGGANDINSLTVAVQARIPDGIKRSSAAQQVRICVHNSSAGLMPDFNNPDFISVSLAGKSYLLPNPRVSYAHSFSKYYEGNVQNWPKFIQPATCSVDATGKATLANRGRL